MKRNLIFPILILTLLIVGYLLFFSDGARRWSPEWEEGIESFQPSTRIMDIVGIEPGMHVGEIGAGNGRFAVRVARRVGDKGKVYANDIDLKAVRFMKQRIERERIGNMQVILSRLTNPYFPKGKLDLIYVINAYENFSDPVRLLANATVSLKRNGKLAIVAYDKDKAQKAGRTGVPKTLIIEQVSEAGFTLVKVDSLSLMYDNVFLFSLTK